MTADETATEERQAHDSGDEPDDKKELHEGDGDRQRTDKSPRPSNESQQLQRAEVSNYEIVTHYFDGA
ncbi:MAG: hypothetical protein ACJ760_14225, partial [Thermoleophilaceae bacterium]